MFSKINEMANYSQEYTGIKDTYIWIGPNPPQHGPRIKISNNSSFFNPHDNFTLTIPDFEIVGIINTKTIDNKKLEQIKDFVKLNIVAIVDYESGIIPTDEFESMIIKISEVKK